LKRMGTWVGVGGTSEQQTASGNDATTTAAQDGEVRTNNDGGPTEGNSKGLADIDSDDGLRMTISHADRYGLTGRLRDDGTINATGRRMSTRDFIKQVQQMDPKAKIQAVNEINASEDLKQEIKRQTQEEKEAPAPDGARKRAETMPSSRPQIRAAETSPTLRWRPEAARRAETQLPSRKDHGDTRPEPVRTTTGESVASDDASREEVPTYDISDTLARHGRGSTAADSRRQRLAKMSSNEETSETEQGETAAEKRRRLAALGEQEEESSSSDEDVSAPRRPREQQVPVPEPSSQSRPRVQWGGESGRERGRERAREGHHHSGGLKSIFGKRAGA
jgi:sodium/hydrogen antiporter